MVGDLDTEFPMSLKNGSSHRGSLPFTDWHRKQPMAELPTNLFLLLVTMQIKITSLFKAELPHPIYISICRIAFHFERAYLGCCK